MMMVMRLQRLLSPEEGLEYTNCLSYKLRPAGNIASRSHVLIILVAMLSLNLFISNSHETLVRPPGTSLGA